MKGKKKELAKPSFLEVLEQKFPTSRPPPKNFLESFNNYEKRSEKQKEVKAEERSEGIAVFKAVTPSNVSPEVVVLDCKDQLHALAILEAYPTSKIFIANPCASKFSESPNFKLIKDKYPNQVHHYGATIEEFIRCVADLKHSGYKLFLKLNYVALDYCGYCGDAQYQTISLFASLDILRRDQPIVFQIVTSKRDKNGKGKGEYVQRTNIDGWVQSCFQQNGYVVHKPGALCQPRVTGVVTWTYVITSVEWEGDVPDLYSRVAKALDNFEFRREREVRTLPYSTKPVDESIITEPKRAEFVKGSRVSVLVSDLAGFKDSSYCRISGRVEKCGNERVTVRLGDGFDEIVCVNRKRLKREPEPRSNYFWRRGDEVLVLHEEEEDGKLFKTWWEATIDSYDVEEEKWLVKWKIYYNDYGDQAFVDSDKILPAS